MMNDATTRSPGLTLFTSGATPSTVPATSWPSTAGSGKAISPLITSRSECHTPQAATLISTSPARGLGSRTSSMLSGEPTSSKTAAFK